LIVAGRWSSLDYLSHRFFAGEPSREPLGRAPVWKLPGILRTLGASADLTVARVDALAARLFFDASHLPLPDWVGCTLTIPACTADLARASGSLHADFHFLRKYGYECRISHAESDLAVFYETMHVPFIRERHPQATELEPYDVLRRVFSRGCLLWILREGRPIAGLLLTNEGDHLRFFVNGVAGADRTLLKQGALFATYYHAIEYTRQQGFRRLYLGGCRPCLHDGVLRYKLKWGAIISPQKHLCHRLMVRASKVSETVAAFLAHTPLIFHDRDGFSALHVESAAAAPPTKGLQRLYLARIGQSWGAREAMRVGY
jgi:hypothetical protein